MEPNHVPHVRAAPLVDRLVVVADNGQLDWRLGEPIDEGLLHRVDVLVLIDQQVGEATADLVQHHRVLEGLDGERDELAEREQPIAGEQIAVGPIAGPQGRFAELGGADVLVGDDVGRTGEVAHRLPVLPAEPAEPEPVVLTREEGGVPVLVERVEVVVARGVRLEDPQTVAVDRPDEQRRQAVAPLPAQLLGDALRNPIPEFPSRPLGERERDDRCRGDALADERRNALRHRLRLSRPGTSDDLDVRPPVVDQCLLGSGKNWRVRHKLRRGLYLPHWALSASRAASKGAGVSQLSHQTTRT